MTRYKIVNIMHALFFIPAVCLLLMPLCACQNPWPLIIDHDAGVDDFISSTLQLLYCPGRIKAVTISPADSYIEPALWVMKHLQNLLLPPSSSLNIPIGISQFEGLNPFPSVWREDAWKLTELPIWGEQKTSHEEIAIESWSHDHTAFAVLVNVLQKTPVPVDILETGPCSNIAKVLTYCPQLKKKIHRMYIMGGAVYIDGNVKEDPIKHNGKAEWNIYNNPLAFYTVLASGIPITLISLDATQFTPIRPAFMKKLEQHCNHASVQFVFQSLMTIKPVIDIGQYMFWDTLTSAVVIDPSLVKTEKIKINVVLAGKAMGQTFEDKEHGFEVDLAVWANQERFEKMVLSILVGKMNV